MSASSSSPAARRRVNRGSTRRRGSASSPPRLAVSPSRTQPSAAPRRRGRWRDRVRSAAGAGRAPAPAGRARAACSYTKSTVSPPRDAVGGTAWWTTSTRQDDELVLSGRLGRAACADSSVSCHQAWRSSVRGVGTLPAGRGALRARAAKYCVGNRDTVGGLLASDAVSAPVHGEVAAGLRVLLVHPRDEHTTQCSTVLPIGVDSRRARRPRAPRLPATLRAAPRAAQRRTRARPASHAASAPPGLGVIQGRERTTAPSSVAAVACLLVVAAEARRGPGEGLLHRPGVNDVAAGAHRDRVLRIRPAGARPRRRWTARKTWPPPRYCGADGARGGHCGTLATRVRAHACR